MKTIIMAGGKGSRVSTLFPDIPKPMIKIDGMPILEREIENLRSQGFNDIIITISYLGHKIKEYFGDGSGISEATGLPFRVRIQYYEEEIPLGNAGALFKLRDQLTDDFLLLNADSLFDVDFKRFVDFHKEHKGLVSLFTHPNSHPYDSGLIVADSNHQVIEWLTKEDSRPVYYHNRVNAGLHVISPFVLDECGVKASEIGSINSKGKVIKVDLDRDILKPLAGKGKMFCYDSPEYVKDMGTPDRFITVERDFFKGIIQSKNLNKSQKAIFLDRDGTINRYVGFLRTPEELELIPGVAEAICKINKSEYLAIVVTNQPVIARGEVTRAGLDEIHKKMETLLGEKGAYVDGIFYCPHHPDKGYSGEISELKIDCDCRKPKPGLLYTAANKFNIDLTQSIMIGDSDNDLKAGNTAGCISLKIPTNQDGILSEIIEKILGE